MIRDQAYLVNSAALGGTRMKRVGMKVKRSTAGSTWGAIAAVCLAAAAASFTVAGCSATTTGDKPAGAAQTPAVTTAGRSLPTSSTTPRPASSPSKTTSLPASAGSIANSVGAILPNPARTPGVVNPEVTQADVEQTICVAGWTATVRPPSSVTTSLKIAQLKSGYAYKGDHSTSDYEEDHLISLEIGGSPSAPANLWPEPYNSPEGARVKDVVENRLHALVCDHRISLATAQHAIASNWWTAYKKYVGAPPSGTSYVRPRPTHSPSSVAAGTGPTAKCNDGTYSYAAHHQGACSHHGGVAVFYR